MKEEWKDIVGYEGLYRISNFGRVMSLYKNRIMRPYKNKSGYVSVALHKNGLQKTHYVHRLVLLTFIGKPSKGQQCCHNDGEGANNCLTNLRWGSPKQNNQDKYRHGTHRAGVRSPF